jgi:hypothetical protein
LNWTSFGSIVDLLRWLEYSASGPPPEAYGLRTPGATRQRMLQLGLISPSGPDVHVRPESGTVDIRFAPNFYVSDAVSFARRVADVIDEPRELMTTEIANQLAVPPQRSAVVTEYASLINGLESIGPGGRCTIYSDPVRVTAEVSIHAREHRVDTWWRHPRDVAEVVSAEMADVGESGRIKASLGYFEKSAFEPQSWLRPVFAFVLEAEATADQPGLRRAFVEAATDSPDLGISDGLEGWCSEA